jgi:hypothetical protein
MWAGVMENPIGKRAVWTGVLVGAGLLLVGGIAYASTKGKGKGEPGPGPSGPPKLKTTPDIACTNYHPTANAVATQIATSIAGGTAALPWVDGAIYYAVIDGVQWRFRSGWNVTKAGTMGVVSDRCMSQ